MSFERAGMAHYGEHEHRKGPRVWRGDERDELLEQMPCEREVRAGYPCVERREHRQRIAAREEQEEAEAAVEEPQEEVQLPVTVEVPDFLSKYLSLVNSQSRAFFLEIDRRISVEEQLKEERLAMSPSPKGPIRSPSKLPPTSRRKPFTIIDSDLELEEERVDQKKGVVSGIGVKESSKGANSEGSSKGEKQGRGGG
jgi:hypothetical protein